MSIYPVDQGRHRPVIKNGGARVIAAKSLRARAGFAYLLAVVEHDRSTREPIKNPRNWPSNIPPDAAPLRLRGESHLVVILGVAKRVIENKGIALDRIEIIRPGRT